MFQQLRETVSDRRRFYAGLARVEMALYGAAGVVCLRLMLRHAQAIL